MVYSVAKPSAINGIFSGVSSVCHVDHDLSVVGQVQLHDTAGCLNTNIAFAVSSDRRRNGQNNMFRYHSFQLPAVGIENPVLKSTSGRVGFSTTSSWSKPIPSYGPTVQQHAGRMFALCVIRSTTTKSLPIPHLAEFKPHILSLYPG